MKYKIGDIFIFDNLNYKGNIYKIIKCMNEDAAPYDVVYEVLKNNKKDLGNNWFQIGSLKDEWAVILGTNRNIIKILYE